MMEMTEKRLLSTEDMQKEQKEEQKFTLAPSESAFFSQLEKSLKNYATDMTSPKPLEMLYENFRRLSRLLVSFERPWLADCGIIQKACAWYLAYAKPNKEDACRLIETMNGFTVSVCQLSEWNELTHKMQAFFRVQEKELKSLFDYEQQTERRHREREERLKAEGTSYCLTIGEGEIYGVTYSQIADLHRVMGRFIEREKAPFQCKVKDHGKYVVSISKYVGLHADRDEFCVNYSLDNIDSDFDWMPVGQLQRVADAISSFLTVYGEEGEREVRWDMADYSETSQPDFLFSIDKDGRMPTFRSVPWVSKRICQEEGKATEMEYYIDVNELRSPELSFGEFVAVYRKLGEFLDKRMGK